MLLFKFRCNIFIVVRIIKEMPGSVASGTHCGSVCVYIYIISLYFPWSYCLGHTFLKWIFLVKKFIFCTQQFYIIESNKLKFIEDCYFLKITISVRNSGCNCWSAGAENNYQRHCLPVRTLCFELQGTFYGRTYQGHICPVTANTVVTRCNDAALR